MKTKIVYIVVSDKDSLYAEQAVVSAYSTRVHNPDAQIEVLVDSITADYLTTNSSYFYRYFDKVRIIDTPVHYTNKQRSRYLKTKLREFVEGDYLFVDTDTIICSSLADIDTLPHDICAVREYNRISQFTTSDEWMYSLAQKVNLVSDLDGEPYFNSGVMFVKDTPCSHSLYKQWHDCWLKTKDYGVDTDQTALCWSNKLEGHVIAHIADCWNCQIKNTGKEFMSDAKIIHYFWGLRESNYPLSHHSFFQSVKELEDVPSIVKDFINTPKLQLVSHEDYLLIRKVTELRSQFRIFYALIDRICKGYVYIRVNWLHRYNYGNKENV